jgi:chemosensory pili system protein ChpA (sensor histidine kinase/response regulator)
MDLLHDSETIDDLSALAWVHDELRRSLEGAHKAMRRYLKEAEAGAGSDVDAVDPAVLRGARSQLHQGVGALELVGLPTAAQLLRAGESALVRLSGRPVKLDAAGVETIERASFALLDYLSRLLAQKPVSPLAMFPQYRAVQELAGADRIHPADLWPHDWQWQSVAADASTPRAADGALRIEVESQTLALMRSGGSEPAGALSDLFAALASGAADKPLATLWRMAAGFFEAQAQGLLVPDVYSKRIASRLLAQLRIGEAQGEAGEVSQRLAQDLLFFCAQAASPGDGRKAPRLAAVRQAWNLARRAPVDYLATQLGRFDPAAIAQARKRVAVAKEGWASVAGGELHRLGTLGEQFQLVAESLKKLFPAGDRLGAALTAAAATTAASGAEPPAALAMEVATAVLYLEAALEDGEFDQPSQAERVQRLAARIAQVREGGPAQALDAWMEELYRRVSDRQTMGSVVQELKSALGEAEKAIDLYFRQTSRNELLHPVPQQLNAMRGVFSVLGLEQASQAIVRMRDDVDALGVGSLDTAAADAATQRLASNLGALGFLIDMLNVQPSMAKSLFAFDAASGLLRSVAAPVRQRASGFGALAEAVPAPAPVEPRFIEQAQSLALAAAHPEVPLADVQSELDRLSQEAMVADQPDLADTMHQVQSAFEVARSDAEKSAVREELAQAMADFVHSTSEPMGLDAPAARALPALPTTPTPAGQTGLEDDAEMREIFLEEAREVIGNANTALAALAQASDDLGEMTTVRRAFHTLKGSSRMVGLKDFGDAAWACEQTYNTRLAEQQNADAALLVLTDDVLAYLADWVDAIGARRAGGHHPAAVQAVVDAYTQRGEAVPLALPNAPAAAAGGLEMAVVSSPMALDELMRALPSAADLELLPAAATLAQPAAGELEALDFELDLGAAATLPMGIGDAIDASAGAADVAPDAVSSMMSLDLPEVIEEPPRAMPVVPVIDVAALAAEAPAVDPAPAFEPEPEPESEPFRQIGPLRVGIPLFNIFLNEADEQSRRLGTELAEWAIEHQQQPIGDSAIAHAHSLAGSSATVGFAELSQLARLLEHALSRSQAIGPGHADEAALFTQAADEIRGLLHQFAAGFLKSPSSALMQRLADHERWAADRLHELSLRAATPEVAAEPDAIDEAPADSVPTPLAAPGRLGRTEYHDLSQVVPFDAAPRAAAQADGQDDDDDDDIDALDAVDAELFPIFQEEAQELLPQLAARMRAWAEHPGDPAGGDACMRTLHTFKGGARLAGAMRLGELAHRLETAVDRLGAREHRQRDDVEALLGRVDALGSAFEALLRGPAPAEAPPAVAAAPAAAVVPATPVAEPVIAEPAVSVESVPVAAAPATAPALPAAAAAAAPIDWQRFTGGDIAADRRGGDRVPGGAGTGTVRVRAPLLDRLVNHAGEVSIARSRIEAEVEQLKGALGDLTENLERMRSHLRDIELQAETQIASRMEAAKSHGESFDPLEMDRFTRFQELTRMMAESVADVATVQRSAQRTVQAAEDDLAAQARLTRDMQDDLLRTRMVEFESLSDRLYRVARQAAKELHKQVRLDIVGGSIEVDRGVLERMGGAFEHLLRNCVTHGIEQPAERQAQGKDATGQITVSVGHEGNEVAVEFRDDGAGLDLGRIRARGVAMGFLAADAQASDAELSQLIFTPGFSTAETVTELSGRGVGMDVVRNEVSAIGGRIETASAPGQGTSFRLVLPLTTAVTQVVMLRAGAVTVAVPATLIEIVKRVPVAEVAAAQASGAYVHNEQTLPFFWLGALLQSGGRSDEVPTRTQPVVIVRSAQQRVALHVDEVVGNQEVVVKNLGAQLARLPGLAGVTLLASGAPALIYNPVALATLYGAQARGAMARRPDAPVEPALRAPAQAPLVLVVDDSLTVRRVTQRLLVREGYRVTLAKDGLDALEKLADEVPAIVLSDIEMPRMDGFDLVRNLRADARLAGLPVVMITSRIAQKHRDHAAELGVDHYLGKPYSEEELLALVARYASAAALAH